MSRPTEIRYQYQEPKPGLNFGIGIGAITFSAETEIAFSIRWENLTLNLNPGTVFCWQNTPHFLCKKITKSEIWGFGIGNGIS